MKFKLGFNHDPESDAVYLQLRDTEYGGGQELDDARHIDLDVDGNVLGIEFLHASAGVDLDGIPPRELDEVQRLLAENGILMCLTAYR